MHLDWLSCNKYDSTWLYSCTFYSSMSGLLRLQPAKQVVESWSSKLAFSQEFKTIFDRIANLFTAVDTSIKWYYLRHIFLMLVQQLPACISCDFSRKLDSWLYSLEFSLRNQLYSRSTSAKHVLIYGSEFPLLGVASLIWKNLISHFGRMPWTELHISVYHNLALWISLLRYITIQHSLLHPYSFILRISCI